MSPIVPWLAVVGVDDGESMYSEDGGTWLAVLGVDDGDSIQLKFPPSTLSPHSGRTCCVCSRSQTALFG